MLGDVENNEYMIVRNRHSPWPSCMMILSNYKMKCFNSPMQYFVNTSVNVSENISLSTFTYRLLHLLNLLKSPLICYLSVLSFHFVLFFFLSIFPWTFTVDCLDTYFWNHILFSLDFLFESGACTFCHLIQER